MSNIAIPSVLAFERKIEPSDALMHSGNWQNIGNNQAWQAISLFERRNRAVKSNFKKEVLENEEELKKWIKLSGLDVKKFFNTSGILYREMNLKDKLKEMNEEEMIKLLATDGKLIKRPLLVSEEGILVGFKEDSYKQII